MNERIVVVEDDQDILEVLSFYLEKAGFQLFKAMMVPMAGGLFYSIIQMLSY